MLLQEISIDGDRETENIERKKKIHRDIGSEQHNPEMS